MKIKMLNSELNQFKFIKNYIMKLVQERNTYQSHVYGDFWYWI